MIPFRYVRVSSDAEAIAASGRTGSKFVAGGTNLLDLIKAGVEAPQQLVDINRLPLSSIEARPDGSFLIGAMVRNSDLAYHPALRANLPVLSEALLAGASPQLRNMATVGGNILQRTRCYYFYDTAFSCNKREPGAGCDAMAGYNRIHAILGTSDKCIAAHPSDMAVALVALDAVIHMKGPAGERSVPIREFYALPGDTPQRENVLQPGELITHVEVPALTFGRRSTYRKVRDRASYAFALVSVAAAMDVHEGRIREARIALGGVGTVPWRAAEAEESLRNAAPGDEAFRRAAEMALANARPRRHNRFKVELARQTIALTLAGLAS